METKRRYFTIGVFILAGMVALVSGLILFGAGQAFKKEILVETYFADSVQGLDVGSPVKYRGVKIGEVKQINTVNYFYNLDHLSDDDLYQYGLYVMVTVSVPAKTFTVLRARDIETEIKMLVEEKGLRLKLEYIGVTGLAFLELDFVEADSVQPLEIKWTPKTYYVPTVPNTIQLVTDSIRDISKSLTTDFIPLVENLNSASETLPQLTATLNETLASLKESMQKVSVAAENVPGLAEKLDEMLFHVNQVFKNEGYEVQEIVDNVRRITDDLKSLTEDLKQNPSQVLFGKPPKRIAVTS